MPELKKVLNYPTILLITINSIMGTGIFFLPSVGARTSGPASIIAWIALSLVSIYIAMCFGELTSMFPKAGGVYEFCKHAYGRFWSFIIGWMTLIAGNITIAMLVVGAIQYLLPVDIPLVKIGLSLFFIFAFNYIAYKGMKTSAVMLITFAFITVGTLLSLIIPGLFKLQLGNFDPFFVFPISSLLLTIFLIAETFFGWETATFLAAETKDGEKVMPKALVYGTIIIAVICILSVVTSLGIIPWQQFGQSIAPLSALGEAHFGSFGRDAFTILVYLSIIGSVAGWIVSAPRLILAMARDKLFLSRFSKIHPVYSTPYKAIILQAFVTAIIVFAGAGSYETLLQLLVPMVLVMYSAVLLSLVVLRFKHPLVKRNYKAPIGKFGPILVIFFMIYLIFMWVQEAHGALQILMLGGSFILIGIPIYFLLELYYNSETLRLIDDILAYIVLWTEKFSLPMHIRRHIIELLGDIKGKKVLEFGCSVGTLTMHLAEEVGPSGMIYATDISQHESNIARKRAEKKGHKHVRVIHDVHHAKRIHPEVPKVHTAVSVGMLGHLEKTEHILKELNKKLHMNAKVCFVDYDSFFDVIPNIEWLSDDRKIKRIFRDAGFHIDIIRKQGFAWKYVFIYGVKFKNI